MLVSKLISVSQLTKIIFTLFNGIFISKIKTMHHDFRIRLQVFTVRLQHDLPIFKLLILLTSANDN